MAFDIDRLKKAHQFQFETKSIGNLLCHNFSISARREAEKWLAESDKKDSFEFARYLITLLCQTIDEKGEESSWIDRKQAKSIKQSELKNFSSLFIESNEYLLEGQCNLVKGDDESETNHLLRVIEANIDQHRIEIEKLFENINKSTFSSATLGLLEENKRISNSLGGAITSREAFEIPEIPENPAFETNRQLSYFGDELSEVSSLIKNMNDLGVQMKIDSANAVARTKLWNNIMFILGLITLFVTAIFSYLSYSSSGDSSNQIKSLLVKQNEILKDQKASQESVHKETLPVTYFLKMDNMRIKDKE